MIFLLYKFIEDLILDILDLCNCYYIGIYSTRPLWISYIWSCLDFLGPIIKYIHRRDNMYAWIYRLRNHFMSWFLIIFTFLLSLPRLHISYNYDSDDFFYNFLLCTFQLDTCYYLYESFFKSLVIKHWHNQ